MIDLIDNLTKIQERIHLAEQKYGRPSGSVSLLPVSKGHSTTAMAQLVALGINAFGENYPQEACEKISALIDKTIQWHFIGAIQSNKTHSIAQNFSWVHTICRLKEAQRLSEFRSPSLAPLQVCVQIKLDENPKKSGIVASQVPALIAAIHTLPSLRLRGLMAVPPPCENFEEQRKYFRLVQELWTQLNEQGAKLDTLSMGMTHDLEAAIAQGATIVRVGQGIFGPRPMTR